MAIKSLKKSSFTAPRQLWSESSMFYCLLQMQVFISVLVLLELSFAFDTVDHNILINCLKTFVGISDTALDWFKSHLAERSFSVMIGRASSYSNPLICGVPQGSILGPLLFSSYILPLRQIICNQCAVPLLHIDCSMTYNCISC